MQYPPNQPPNQPQYGQYPSDQPYSQPLPPQPPTGSYPGQYPPPQQWPGQVPPPPQKKKPPKWAYVVSVVLILVALFACIAAANAGKNVASTNTTSNQVTTAATQEQATPTSSAPQTYKVGDVVKTSIWEVKVNSAKTSQGGEFDSLKSGDIFLEISVSQKNISDKKQVASSLLSWKLRDSEGQEISIAFVSDAPSSPDGNVNAGSSIKGTLAYEIPKSMKSFRLEFLPDILSSELVTWNLTI